MFLGPDTFMYLFSNIASKPFVITLLTIWTPIVEWYMARLIVKNENRQQSNMRQDEIGLHVLGICFVPFYNVNQQ